METFIAQILLWILAASQDPYIMIPLLAWSTAWKGYALWLAARNTHKIWFVAMLLINIVGILEIIYIFAVGRRAMKKRESSAPAVVS
jgi:hypothetical protein